jgi:hypothetical protein
MASLRFGDHHTATRAPPSVPGSTASKPYTASSMLGRTLSAVCTSPLSVLRSPSSRGTLVGSRAKRKSQRARICGGALGSKGRE